MATANVNDECRFRLAMLDQLPNLHRHLAKAEAAMREQERVDDLRLLAGWDCDEEGWRPPVGWVDADLLPEDLVTRLPDVERDEDADWTGPDRLNFSAEDGHEDAIPVNDPVWVAEVYRQYLQAQVPFTVQLVPADSDA